MAKVLVLEDDPALNRLMSLTIAQAGHEVASARSATAGFDSLSPCPDIIVPDLVLKGMDGPTFLSEAMSRGFDGPVVVVSGMEEGKRVADLISAEVFFAKPFNPDDLREAVNRLAEQVEQGQRGQGLS